MEDVQAYPHHLEETRSSSPSFEKPRAFQIVPSKAASFDKGFQHQTFYLYNMNNFYTSIHAQNAL